MRWGDAQSDACLLWRQTEPVLYFLGFSFCGVFFWVFGFFVFNYCSRVGQRLDGIVRLKHDVEVI